MKSELAKKECHPCDGEGPRLTGETLRKIHAQLGDDWRLIEGQRLEKKFKFPDFRSALRFTDRVGEIAEKQGHHPDIALTYGEVHLQIWTHKIGGLTESDFILAARVDEII